MRVSASAPSTASVPRGSSPDWLCRSGSIGPSWRRIGRRGMTIWRSGGCSASSRRCSRTEGRKDGRTEGRKDGRTEGRKDGKTERRKDGKTEGRKDPHTEQPQP